MSNQCKLLFLIFFVFLSNNLKASDGEFKFHLRPRPSFLSSFENEYGNKVRLLNFKGKVIILNLWATYCASCVNELKSLDKLSQDMGGRLHILAISIGKENGAEVKEFFKKHSIKHLDVYIDSRKAISAELQVNAVPISLLINVGGIELARAFGELDFASPVVRAQLKNILRKF